MFFFEPTFRTEEYLTSSNIRPNKTISSFLFSNTTTFNIILLVQKIPDSPNL